MIKETLPIADSTTNPSSDRKMSLTTRGRRPSMFDPIDPKELQQALYASAAAVSCSSLSHRENHHHHHHLLSHLQKGSIVSNAGDEDDSHRAVSHIKISYDRDSEHIFIENLSFENMQTLDSFVNNLTHNNNSNVNSSSSSASNHSSGNNLENIPFYCRFRLYPERRSLFQTKIVRHARAQTSFTFDVKQLNDFELSYDQLNNHSIELILYKVGTNKPAYKDIRIATVKYDLASLNEIDRISVKKPLEESDVITSVQVRNVTCISLRNDRC